MHKAVRLFELLVAGLTGLSLLVVFLVVFASSVSRYVFNHSFQWGEEMATYAMVYGTMFGVILAYLHGKHVRFAFLQNLVLKNHAGLIGRIIDLVTLILGVALAVSGYLFVGSRGGILSSGIGIHMAWFQVAIPIGGAGLALAALIRLFVGEGAADDREAQR